MYNTNTLRDGSGKAHVRGCMARVLLSQRAWVVDGLKEAVLLGKRRSRKRAAFSVRTEGATRGDFAIRYAVKKETQALIINSYFHATALEVGCCRVRVWLKYATGRDASSASFWGFAFGSRFRRWRLPIL